MPHVLYKFYNLVLKADPTDEDPFPFVIRSTPDEIQMTVYSLEDTFRDVFPDCRITIESDSDAELEDRLYFAVYHKYMYGYGRMKGIKDGSLFYFCYYKDEIL